MDHRIRGDFVLFTGASTNKRTGVSLLALCGHLYSYTLVSDSHLSCSFWWFIFSYFNWAACIPFHMFYNYVEHASRWFYAPTQLHLTNSEQECLHFPWWLSLALHQLELGGTCLMLLHLVEAVVPSTNREAEYPHSVGPYQLNTCV